MNASQKKIKDLGKKRAEKLNLTSFKQFVQHGSSMYSAVYRFYTNTTLHSEYNLNKIGNKGNFYQVYRFLYLSNHRNNKIIPSNDEIANAFRRTLSNVGSSGSFAHGGDIGLEQDKAANATFLDIKTLCNILYETANAIQQSLELNNTEIFVKMLSSQKTGIQIIDEAAEETTKKIQENMQKILQ